MVQKIYMKPFNNVQKVLDDARNELGENSKVIIMPHGGLTLPD